METPTRYENFPARIVILSATVALIIYLCGFFICFTLRPVVALLYLFFILSLEYKLLSRHCVNCYYWGKVCGFGKGSISSLFFKKGNPATFCDKVPGWKDFLPDLMVAIVPLIIAIFILIKSFDILILATAVTLVFFATLGNGYIRGSLTCRYCKQRDAGCPAEKLLGKK